MEPQSDRDGDQRTVGRDETGPKEETLTRGLKCPKHGPTPTAGSPSFVPTGLQSVSLPDLATRGMLTRRENSLIGKEPLCQPTKDGPPDVT